MKKTILALSLSMLLFSNAEARKIRSDKGGHHKNYGGHSSSFRSSDDSDDSPSSFNIGYLLMIAGAIYLPFGIYSDMKNKKSKKDPIDFFEGEKLQFVQELERRKTQNESLPMKEVKNLYEKMTDKTANTLDITSEVLGFDYLSKPNSSAEYKVGAYLEELLFLLYERDNIENGFIPTMSEEDAYKKHGINLKEGEVLLKKMTKVDLQEEKSITVSTFYGGMQYRIGLGGGASYRMGSISSTPIKKEEFSPIDRGNLFLTNRRMIFIGTSKKVTRTLQIDSILEFQFFKDGILIGIEKGKKPLFTFPELISPDGVTVQRDEINLIPRILDKVISKEI